MLTGMRTASGMTVDVDGEALVLRLRGRDAFFALRRQLRVPVSGVAGVSVAPQHRVPRAGMGLRSTTLPGVLRAGTFGGRTGREFWLVRQADYLLVIELES